MSVATMIGACARRLVKSLPVFTVLQFILATNALAAPDSLQHLSLADTVSPVIKPMGLFDLSFGAVFHTSKMIVPDGPEQTNYGIGVGGRMQTSILWNYRAARPQKRFAWGDVISAEVFTGTLSTSLLHESGNLWLGYRFDFGFGGRWTLNSKTDIGLNIILLTFSRDNVSGNLSGSGITGRVRYGRVLADVGVTARHDRALGVVIDVRDKIPMQGVFSLRYLMPHGKNVGITAENLFGTYPQDNLKYKNTWSLRLSYGIYF